jgi:threonine-phosphate decarboxylase
LKDPGYYGERYAETHMLREGLSAQLKALGWQVVPGTANFLLADLPERWPSAPQLVQACREHGLFLRDASNLGSNLGPRSIRVAVKDHATNLRIAAILETVRRASRQWV